VFPSKPEWDYRIIRAHADLAQSHQAGAILTVPLHSGERVLGALTFERPQGEEFDEPTIELCDCVASVIGPILEEKRRNDRNILLKLAESFWIQLRRLLGPRYFGRKLATVVAIAVVAFFMVAKGDYRVTSPAILEGEIQRTLVAPFEGYLASQHARAGEIVREGDLLATLDDKDLALERLRWSTQRRQHLSEYDRALADRERAEANIIRAQIEQAQAQVALLDEQLARTRITAPFDGIVVEGDLTQEVGAALKRGQELFKIAPLDAYRVILEVDEGDIDTIAVGQTGTLAVASMPDTPLDYTVERVTPISEQQEGRNFFRVEATLHQANDRLRPGMKGIAKTQVEERLLIFIWTEKLLDWVRLQLWKWLP
ncbi:MAG TPA: HlyD family efflux transporter periplasmic adaptor subunit, partial [Gammaproteobacteria bacterium]|nr:HlyD family efflux transporter periplasmic adaptor subunit [Gammaproteobacteria bacterium]